MGDDDRAGQQLPHRAPGPAEAKSARAASPSLSAETRQRMQAAVESERARATGQDQEPAEPARRAIAPGPVGHAGPAPSTSQHQPSPPIQPGTPEPAVYPLPAAVAPVTGRPAAGKPGGRRRGALTGAIATALVLIAAGSLGVAVARYITGWEAGTGSQTALTPAQAYEDHVAARWVAAQVSHTAVVSCDPAMCTALTAAGFPSREVRTLEPTAPPPVTAAVVIVTQAVREQFGTNLTYSYAPAILATFGSAEASVTVQVIDAQGARAYQKALGADLKERKSAGINLAGAANLTMSAGAKRQLLAGAPDLRLLVALTNLVSREPIDILDFGNYPPGADSTIPLRYADLAGNDQAAQAAHLTVSAYVRALRAVLDSISFTPARPTRIVTVTVDGQAALRVEFAAPSLLALFGK